MSPDTYETHPDHTYLLLVGPLPTLWAEAFGASAH